MYQRNCNFLGPSFRLCCLIPFALFLTSTYRAEPASWQLGPFTRLEEANPLIVPMPTSIFLCPVQAKEIPWEGKHTFNPAAVVRQGKVYLLYRAEDNYGDRIGDHTSRLGLAISEDGVHFHKNGAPVFFPDKDGQEDFEFPGGCEDPRIVETEEGTYVMTYTQWNRKIAVLASATSTDLIHWQKQGYVFKGKEMRFWSKSGSIVCRREGDSLIATKVGGKYWMYWGEGSIYGAISDDLIRWTPVRDKEGGLLPILNPRPGKFDSQLVEAGPPALITSEGIVLLYNGKNEERAYSAGQVLFDLNNPAQVKERTETPFLTPQRSYERKGQYAAGTVFIEGLVPFQGKWRLYYGGADSAVGGAEAPLN